MGRLWRRSSRCASLKQKWQAAWAIASPQLRKSLRQAAQNIRRFCEWQKPAVWMRTRAGISLGQLVRPLESVGCYVPGGRYPLVSTLLMTVIPAQVAGVKNIRVVSPKPSPEVLAAAAMLGVREFYPRRRSAGDRGIGVRHQEHSARRQDRWTRKRLCHGCEEAGLVRLRDRFSCGTDRSGCSERFGRSPNFIAADLVAQAEHDPEALAVFITTSRKLAQSAVETM